MEAAILCVLYSALLQLLSEPDSTECGHYNNNNPGYCLA